MNVSVIIPCYNAEKYLYETIKSIIDQTLKPAEIVFINDCSTDKTVDIIRRFKMYYEDEFNIRLINIKRNRGIGYTRQAGLRYAEYPYVSYLSSDDCWDKMFLEESIKKLGNRVGTYTDYYRCNSMLIPERIYRAENFSIDKIIDYALMRNMFINFSSIIIPKNIDFKFMEHLRHGEDIIFLLDSVIHGIEWVRIPKPLLYYRIHEKQGTYTKGITEDYLINLNIERKLIELGINEELVRMKLHEDFNKRYGKNNELKKIGKYLLKLFKII